MSSCSVNFLVGAEGVAHIYSSSSSSDSCCLVYPGQPQLSGQTKSDLEEIPRLRQSTDTVWMTLRAGKGGGWGCPSRLLFSPLSTGKKQSLEQISSFEKNIEIYPPANECDQEWNGYRVLKRRSRLPRAQRARNRKHNSCNGKPTEKVAINLKAGIAQTRRGISGRDVALACVTSRLYFTADSITE